MLHKALAGRVVIHNGHVATLVGVEHGNVHLHHSLVLPQGCGRTGVQLHLQRHRLRLVKNQFRYCLIALIE